MLDFVYEGYLFTICISNKSFFFFKNYLRLPPCPTLRFRFLATSDHLWLETSSIHPETTNKLESRKV